MPTNGFERLKTVSSSHRVLEGTRRKEKQLREIREREIKNAGLLALPPGDLFLWMGPWSKVM